MASISSTRPRSSEGGELDLVVAATHNAVMMVESEAKELSEEVMLGASSSPTMPSQQVIDAIIRLAEQSAKDPWELDRGRRHGVSSSCAT
jgi:polyribonucleotide nucleotidyltransferase